MFVAVWLPLSAPLCPLSLPRANWTLSNAHPAAVRVRPPLKSGDPGFDLVPTRFRGSTVHLSSDSSIAVDAAGGRKLFVFDRVFGEDIDQEGVFDYVSDSVNSFVEGYNVSILAYGQSGAGKSYTMGTTGPRDQNNAEIMGGFCRLAKEGENTVADRRQVSFRARPLHCSRSSTARVAPLGRAREYARPRVYRAWELRRACTASLRAARAGS